MREVENLKEAGSRGAGIRVLVGPAHGIVLHFRSVARRHRDDGARGARTGEDHQRRSVRGLAGRRRTSGTLNGDLRLYDDAIASMETEWKIEQAQARRRGRARDRSAHSEFRRRVVRFLSGRARVREFARFLGQLPDLELRPERRRPWPSRTARWSAITGTRRRARRRGSKAPKRSARRAAERALRRLNPRKVATQKAPVIFRAAHRAIAAGRYVRRGERRRDLPARVVSGGQAGREDRVGGSDRDRRCDHARPVRQLAVRRRRRDVRGAPW